MGEHEGEKKLHLLAWDTIQRDKSIGGLGLNNLKSPNIAFLWKLCWKLVTDEKALWARVLKAKYKQGEKDIPEVKTMVGASFTWRSITKVWESFQEGLGRKLESGR